MVLTQPLGKNWDRQGLGDTKHDTGGARGLDARAHMSLHTLSFGVTGHVCISTMHKLVCLQKVQHQVQPSTAYRATGGVSAMVMGTLRGSRAFVHKKAMASDDPGPVSRLANQPLSSGFLSE